MKIINKLSIVLFTLCLIFNAIALPTLIISTSESFYKNEFIKLGTYPDEKSIVPINYIGGESFKIAGFTQSQIDDIIQHITEFLSGKKKSFALKMDNVNINGTFMNDVDIFSEISVVHMDDVRQLFNTVKTITVFTVTIMIGCGIWMLTHKDEIRKDIFRYSVCSILAFIALIAVFLMIVLIRTATTSELTADNFLDTLWELMHYIFFPFDSNKFSGSFFNDTLTMILTLDFFMNTVLTVVTTLFAFVLAWLFSAKLIEKRS